MSAYGKQDAKPWQWILAVSFILREESDPALREAGSTRGGYCPMSRSVLSLEPFGRYRGIGWWGYRPMNNSTKRGLRKITKSEEALGRGAISCDVWVEGEQQ